MKLPRMRSRFVMILSVAMLQSIASAYFFDGGELKKLFTFRDGTGQMIAKGYVAGVQDVFNGSHFCVSENLRLSQSTVIVEKYLDEHPEHLHKPSLAKALCLRGSIAC
jgi:hypothetical protein